MANVKLVSLTQFATRVFKKWGVPAGEARYLAETAVETEAFRQSTHGIIQLKAAVDLIKNKKVDPKGRPRIVKNAGAFAVLEGPRCLGNVVIRKAVQLAGEKAHRHGVGFVAVRNTQWVAALGFHLIPLARRGILAKAWAQAASCKDSAPPGGLDPRFSTNPIAIAIPASPNPVIADFSTSTMSWAAAVAMDKAGKKASSPRFLDKRGRLSRVPGDFLNGGSLLFAGGDVDGHKAFSHAMFNEALAVLAGGSGNHPQRPNYQSFSVMALNPAAFGQAGYFKTEINRFLKHVKSSRPRPGHSVRLPGERGFAAQRKARKAGLLLSKDKIAMLEALGVESGLGKDAWRR